MRDLPQRGTGWISDDVLNPERFEHAVLCGSPEWLSGDSLREPGHDTVPGIRVAKLVSWGRYQWQLAHLIDHGFDRVPILIPRLARTDIFRQPGYMAQELSCANCGPQALECRIGSFGTCRGTATELR